MRHDVLQDWIVRILELRNIAMMLVDVFNGFVFDSEERPIQWNNLNLDQPVLLGIARYSSETPGVRTFKRKKRNTGVRCISQKLTMSRGVSEDLRSVTASVPTDYVDTVRKAVRTEVIVAEIAGQ